MALNNIYQKYQFAKAGINPEAFVSQEAYFETNDVTNEMEKLSKEYDTFEVDYVSVTNLNFDNPELIDRFLKNNSIIKEMKISRESLSISTEKEEEKKDKRGFLRRIFDFIINTFKSIFTKLLKFLNWVGKQFGIIVDEAEEMEEEGQNASTAAKMTAKQIAKRAAVLSKKGIKTSAALGAEFAVLAGCAVIGTGVFAKYVGEETWRRAGKWLSGPKKPQELVKQTDNVDEIKAKADIIADGISNMVKEDKSANSQFEQFKSTILYEPDETGWPLFAFDRSKEPFSNSQLDRVRELETIMFSNLNTLKTAANPRFVLSAVQGVLNQYKDDIIKGGNAQRISDDLRRKLVSSIYQKIVSNLKDLKAPTVRGNISDSKYVSYQQGRLEQALGATDAAAQHEKFKKVFIAMFAAKADKFNPNEAHPYKKITIDTTRVLSLRRYISKLCQEFNRSANDVNRQINDYNKQQSMIYNLDNVTAALEINLNDATQYKVGAVNHVKTAGGASGTFTANAPVGTNRKTDRIIHFLQEDVSKIFKNMEELHTTISKAYVSILVDAMRLFGQQNKALDAHLTIKVTEK